ncbi:MAG: virulence-associated E family protein [Clostridia bacterium]|nr:virulence-associated E family protein [Clostridia bacterium]
MTEAIKYKEPSSLTRDDLFEEETYLVMEEMDDIERARYQAELVEQARTLKVSVVEVRRLAKVCLEKIREDEKAYEREHAQEGKKVVLEWGENGPAATVENFMRIFRADDFFCTLQFNELSGSPERRTANGPVRWQDVDDSKARYHIEKTHKLSSLKKYEDAIRVRFDEVRYHPVKELIEPLQWDGMERIDVILTKWMKCEDTPYVREVSRLIFAGGIYRIYRPGCKFDDVPILVGPRQGEGKSTFCRWLAMDDRFFREVAEIEGQKGIEAIEGGWICEMSELLALTKVKEVEAVKSYMTRQVDTYRRPYDKRISEHPRQCVFIGTTNKQQFLTDKTGNRRYYPVVVNQSGYELFQHEEEIKADIRQCWAEAKWKFDRGELPACANPKLIADIRKAQKGAAEEDWREELIIDFIVDKQEVCVRQLWHEALEMPSTQKPTRKESNEITLILQATGEWERAEGTKRIDPYGMSRYWKRRQFDTPKMEMKCETKKEVGFKKSEETGNMSKKMDLGF